MGRGAMLGGGDWGGGVGEGDKLGDRYWGGGGWLNGIQISQIDLFTLIITSSSPLLYTTNSYC